MHNLFEAGDFSGENIAADAAEAIVATAGIAIVAGSGGGFGRFFDKAMVHEFFEVVVERARTEFVLALRLASDFLHDAVAVKIFGSEREQDMELGGGERKKSVEVVFHDRKPIYRNPSMIVKTQSGWYRKKVDSRQLKVEREEEEKDNAETRRTPRLAESWSATVGLRSFASLRMTNPGAATALSRLRTTQRSTCIFGSLCDAAQLECGG